MVGATSEGLGHSSGLVGALDLRWKLALLGQYQVRMGQQAGWYELKLTPFYLSPSESLLGPPPGKGWR